jgi:hypothetical protein
MSQELEISPHSVASPPREAHDTPSDSEVSRSRSRSVFHTVFSFPVAIGALLSVLATFTARSRFSDPDMWWHLKTGAIVWNTHSIPHMDLFSFTAYHHVYVPQEWLAQWLIYAAYRFGGYGGLMLWLWVFSSLLAIGGYALCCLYSGSTRAAFLGGMGIWFFATFGLSIRPQLLGYLLLICQLLVVRFGRTRNPNWFLLLPPVYVVWVNCHASFFLGLIALGAILFSAFVEFRFGLLVSRRWSSSQRRMLSAAFLLSTAAIFVNPTGVSAVLYPIRFMSSLPLNTHFVTEWQPASFDDMRAWGLLGTGGLILLLPLLRRVDLTLEDLLLFGLGFGLAIQHGRMHFAFGILAMPVLCRLLADARGAHRAARRDRVALNAAVIAVAVVSIALGFPSADNLKEQINRNNPVKAVEFIRRAGLSGRMLNDYVYGGYLIWAAPERKVFVDGRADLFEWAGVLGDYLRWSTIQESPRLLPDKYHIDYCLLSRQSPISQVLQVLPGWKSVYTDNMSVVFVRSVSGSSLAAR